MSERGKLYKCFERSGRGEKRLKNPLQRLELSTLTSHETTSSDVLQTLTPHPQCHFHFVHNRLKHLLDDFALKLLGAPPLANALQTVAVVAVGEDAKAALAKVDLLKHHLHAHAAHHVLAALDGK